VRFDFLVELTRRRIVDRYIGTSSRVVWVLFSPLIPLVLNVGVFYFIAKIPQIQSMGLAAYAIFMFSGLLPFRIIQKAAVEGCDLLIANLDMLKTAVFPLPFLSLSTVAASLFEFLVQCFFIAVLLAVAGTSLTWTIVLLPLALVVLFTLALGLSWLLSVLGYALRDLQEIVGLAFSIALYLTPIIYPPEAAPRSLQILMYLNPITSYVVMFRDVIVPEQAGLHGQAWLTACTTSIIVLVIGYSSVRKAQLFVGDMV
jgi:lipopolysaccharide transport system permease protein